MATTQIFIDHYLETSYRPDREYIDGLVRERGLGTWEHARMQLLLASWFSRNEAHWRVMASTEQRVRVSPSRVRVPDLAVVTEVPGPVIEKPLLLAIEILSPDDTVSEAKREAEDYFRFRMGSTTVWIVDLKSRQGHCGTSSGWEQGSRLTVAGTPLHVELSDLFGHLNQPQP